MHELWVNVVDHVNWYLHACPVAPYTGYGVLGGLVVVLFVLWRGAAVKAKHVHKSNEALLKALGDPTKQHQDLLRTVQGMHAETLSAVTAVVHSFNGE